MPLAFALTLQRRTLWSHVSQPAHLRRQRGQAVQVQLERLQARAEGNGGSYEVEVVDVKPQRRESRQLADAVRQPSRFD